MRFYAHEKLAIVLDGPNFWHAAKGLGWDVDFKRLQDFFARQALLTSSCFFATCGGGEHFNPLRPLADWLDFNGWQVTTRPKHTDVDLAVAVMEMADSIHHLVLATGDGNFTALVEAMQRRAVRVTILSTTKGPDARCSEELRRSADDFIELDGLREQIERVGRPAREAATA